MNAEGRAVSGLGLDAIGDLSELLEPVAALGGTALDVPIDLIDPDPEQPRREGNPGFTAESLEELATTIRTRGVRSPISIRPNLEIEGRFVINHGERRWRASRIAGLETIRAFIDTDHSLDDQVIENLQRDDLTAREIADYIGRKVSEGVKQKEIAETIGKSNAFVSQHRTLLSLPEPVEEAFSSARVSDVTLVNELATAYKKYPEDVTAWLADASHDVTRQSIKLMRQFWESKDQTASETAPSASTHDEGDDAESGLDQKIDQGGENTTLGSGEESAVDKLLTGNEPRIAGVVLVEHAKRSAKMILDRRPKKGSSWIRYVDNGDIELVALKELVLLEIVTEG